MRLGIPRNPALTLVLILPACGVYCLYYIYVTSQKVQDFLNEPDTSPGLLDLVGIGGFASLGLLNPLLQQEGLNRVWRAAENAR